jgi:hypothetical protein
MRRRRRRRRRWWSGGRRSCRSGAAVLSVEGWSEGSTTSQT